VVEWRSQARMNNDFQPAKSFDRNARLWGAPAAGRLAASHVMVLGLGGVGSYAAEALARAGVGRLTLVDFDEVCITNVNRQLHALPSTVGQSKAHLMAERARQINPEATVEGVHLFYEAKTAADLFARGPDVIVDCIDNVTAKLHLLATCILRPLPIVTCLGASGKLETTKVQFADLRKTHEDPLAKTIRKNLWRKYQINLQRVSQLYTVFSDEIPTPPNPAYHSPLCAATCVCPNSRNQHHSCAKRNVIWGSAVFVTSVFGMTAASLATRFLLGDPSVNLVPLFKPLPGDDPPLDPFAGGAQNL
jgi:tRNA threonylcarbamoyladenosine dehydratase